MMRKILLTMLFLCAAAAGAQTNCVTGGGVTCTNNLDLWVLPNHYQNWGVPWDENAQAIDAFAGDVVLKTPTASQTVAQPLATYLNVNTELIYGTSLYFGTAPGTYDSILSRASPGAFTMDSTVPGNKMGTLTLRAVNAIVGYQLNSGAPVGHVLCGNGSVYADCATVPGNFYYQHVHNPPGFVQPQEVNLTFDAQFASVDNPGNSTEISLADTGAIPGTYANPNMTVDEFGRITDISNGSAPSFSQIEIGQFGGCTVTSGGSYTACIVHGVWPVSFPNTNYSVACTGKNPTSTGGSWQAVISGYQNKTAAGIDIVVVTQGTAYPQGFAGVDCTAFHS